MMLDAVYWYARHYGALWLLRGREYLTESAVMTPSSSITLITRQKSHVGCLLGRVLARRLPPITCLELSIQKLLSLHYRLNEHRKECLFHCWSVGNPDEDQTQSRQFFSIFVR